MLAQVQHGQNKLPEGQRVSSVVIMGGGEPLANRGFGGFLVNQFVWLESEGDSALVAEQGGRAVAYQEADGARIMQSPEITVRVDLGRGTAGARVYTCDFSYDYVKINGDYRS